MKIFLCNGKIGRRGGRKTRESLFLNIFHAKISFLEGTNFHPPEMTKIYKYWVVSKVKFSNFLSRDFRAIIVIATCI